MEEDTTPNVSLKACHHRRGAHQAQVTKVGLKLTKLLTSGPIHWNRSELDMHQATIDAQVLPYGVIQEHLMLSCDQAPEELVTEAAIADKLEDSVSHWTGEIARMNEVAGLIYRFDTLYRDVITATREEHNRHLSVKVTLYQVAHDALRQRGGSTIQREAKLSELDQQIGDAVDRLERKVLDALPTRPIDSPATERSDRDDSSRTSDQMKVYQKRKHLALVDIPVFSGDILEWPRFWQMFNEQVHSIEQFDKNDKMMCLRKFVRTKTDVISIDDTSSGPEQYDGYVRSLQTKYNQPKLLHECYTSMILNITPMKDSSAEELERVKGAVRRGIYKLKDTKQYDLDAFLTSRTQLLLTDDMREEWSKHTMSQSTVPKVESLLEYLEERATTKGLLTPKTVKPGRPRNDRQGAAPYDRQESPYQGNRYRGGPRQSSPNYKEAYPVQGNWPTCRLCQTETHPIYACPTFLAYNQKGRADYTRSHQLCTNCLSSSHNQESCRNAYRCRECGEKHHTALHLSKETVRAPVSQHGVHFAAPNGVTAVTISPTLELMAHAPDGSHTSVLALFDTGSNISLVTNDVATRLGLQQHQSNVQVVGVDGVVSKQTVSTAMLELTSTHKKGSKLKAKVFVVSTIGGNLTRPAFDYTWPILDTLELANPSFRQPRDLDLLLGNDLLGRMELPDPIIKDDRNGVTARSTIFGWVINGSTTDTRWVDSGKRCVRIATTRDIAFKLIAEQQRTTDCIQQFFKSEAIPEETAHRAEDLAALKHYDETHRILDNGRFQVTLPRLPNGPELGLSRSQAVRRFMTNERSLFRKGGWKAFQDVVAEYVELGHAELVPEVDLHASPVSTYYLPMHAVYKESSTSPLRVVFDASADTTTGVSLNDTLLTGPTVYPSLTDILMRFRIHNIALTADISKMFRAISLNPRDRDLHRFVWRLLPDGPLRDYRMTRVTFGVSCSPFLATQTLQQIATNVSVTHPLTAQTLRTAFYVDDLLYGASTENEAHTLLKELQQILEVHDLKLRKWRSNSQAVLGTIPDDLQEKEPVTKTYGPHHHLKTLGIHWDAEGDVFRVSTSKLELTNQVTKRTLASDVAQTYDVLGWFTPSTILMKLLIQDLWKSHHKWDDPADDQTQTLWQQWKAELPSLANHPIPRPYFHHGTTPVNTQLHGFADASLKGYAAVVYLRATYYDAPVTIRLVTAKTKVAHGKGATVPRLELCGTKLLAELIDQVRRALSIPVDRVWGWCDSEIVLFWLDGQRRNNKQYISNRVARTLELVPSKAWRHVPGLDNPADCASRGISPQALADHSLWWQGPSWLHCEPILLPPQPALAHLMEDQATVRETVALVTTQQPLMILSRSSSYDKTRRTLAWIRRFFNNLRAQKTGTTRTTGKRLLLREICQAETELNVQAQSRMFPANHPERWLTDKTTKGLNPKLDEAGVYRVDGRLHNSPLEYATRHPIILRGTDPLTAQLMQHHHLETLHGGPSTVMTSLSRQYFIIYGMAVIKAICRKCVACIRFRTEKEKQLMGQLPKYRVTPGHTFEVVGTDFAGPITISEGKARRRKAFICIFVCMRTKAIHLEPVAGLSTTDFMASLRRFVARRGKPTHILSDNGTNYVGAARELDQAYKLMQTDETLDEVTHYCTSNGIQWKFNPARAPHFGGLWEATVKAVKFHLRRIEYRRTFNYVEMSTMLAQIEAVLNSRPLMAVHAHSPEGVTVLTAGHFLIGRPLTALPETHTPDDANLARRWDSCQQATQRFWREWSRDYLMMFHRRGKWTKPARNVEVGDIVLLREETALRTNVWPLAKVIQVYPGADGFVRAVDLQIGTGVYRRPIAKLTVLVPVTMEECDDGKDLEAVLFARGEDVSV